MITVEWTGNVGHGTREYGSYERAHVISAAGKPPIEGSADPAFRGDGSKWNPEDLLVASLSACHKLWYLHLCAVDGIVVLKYRDEAEGTMIEDAKKGGYFTKVILRPHVTIKAGGDLQKAAELHQTAHEKCFIANSVNFAVSHEPVIEAA